MEHDIAEVRRAVDGATVLKVIIESSVLDDDGIVAACRASEEAGADGEDLHRLPSERRAPEVSSADGRDRWWPPRGQGVRRHPDLEQALAMIDAATRLGCSSSRAILDAVA